MVEFWTVALGITLFLYVLLDGFDLGVGILFGLTTDQARRDAMVAMVAPVWDGNETWLVLTAAILFGAFPPAYSLLLSAFYVPLLLMLASLILRGVAFEFRARGGLARPLWDAGFTLGSLFATFVQGATVGALIVGIPEVDGRYVGGPFTWASPFAILCGIGLCLGYSLLGAGWLVRKGQGEIRDHAYRMLTPLLASVIVFLAVASAYSFWLDLPVLHRWIDRPVLAVFPIMGLAAVWTVVKGVAGRRDRLPFVGAAGIFASAFGALACSFLPYIVPFRMTLDQAAAPASSLAFLFWGAGLFVLPITLIYTASVYYIFRGKTVQSER